MTIGDTVRTLPGAGINQTSFLFGALLFAYLFFITVRGDLSKWLGILGLAGTSATSSTGLSSTGLSSTGLSSSLNPDALPVSPADTGGLALPALPNVTGDGLYTGAGAGGIT